MRTVLSVALLSGSVPLRAPAAVDGVEFQPVPVNIANRCSGTILKGTNKYRGYAFKLPHVMLGVDKNYEDLFEILPKGNGQYTLRFGLYFPLAAENVEIRRERSNLFTRVCDDNIILADLNESEKRESERNGKAVTAPADSTVFENKVHTLAPLPISQIVVAIDGFQNMQRSIPDKVENNILNYQDRDIPVEFTIPDEETYRDIKEQLTGKIGLSVSLQLNFAAKSVNGRAEVKMNVKSLANSLEAAAGGKMDVAKIVVGEADLRSFFAAAISKMQLSVRTEQGSDDNALRIANEVITRIISANLQATPMIPGQTWNPNSCVNNPAGAGCGGYGGYGGYGSYGYPGTTGGTYPDPNSTGNGTLTGPPQAGLGTPGPVLPHTPNPDPNGRYFNLGAVLNALKTQTEQSFVWENFGKIETHSYTTNVVIRGEIPEPGYKTLNVVAGNSDADASTLPTYIRAGQEVRIKIPSTRELVSSYTRRTTYLNKDEIRRQGLSQHFGALQEAMAKDQLKEMISQERGGYVAVYDQNADLFGLQRWYQGLAKARYSWGTDELRRTTTMRAPEDLTVSPETLEKLPLRVTFHEIGTRFKISDLAKETDKWSGRYEDEQIFLVAKKNLGFMKIRNYDTEKLIDARCQGAQQTQDCGAKSRQPEKYLFEVKDLLVKPKELPAGKTLADMRQYSYVKFSTSTANPTDRVATPSLAPYQLRKSVYVVMVHVGGDLSSAKGQPEEIKAEVKTQTNAAEPQPGAVVNSLDIPTP